jgi:trehalose 6-phosphate phosphatase
MPLTPPPAPAWPALPPRPALLLDFDGTLVDIAPHPHAVIIPPDLGVLLEALGSRLGGALALVSGRPLADLDLFLPGLRVAVAAEHGGLFRFHPEGPIERLPLRRPPAAWREAAERLAASHPGLLYEPKEGSFVIHYRDAPERREEVRAALARLIEGAEGFDLLPSHMAWEVRPKGANKAAAVRFLMSRPPFAGRIPIFIGDDVTDEEGMEAARALAGLGLRVPETFGSPAGVRAWLASLLEEGRLSG